MLVRPYDEIHYLVVDYARSISSELRRLVAETPERGGVVVRRRDLRQPTRFVWSKSSDIAAVVGSVSRNKILEFERMSEPEWLYTMARIESHGYKRAGGAEEMFRNWVQRLKPCRFHLVEVVALSDSPEFIAITNTYWKRGFCAIFGPRSWMVTRSIVLDRLTTINGPHGFEAWLADAKEFVRLFSRELELLESDTHCCLPVISALRYPDQAMKVMRKNGGTNAPSDSGLRMR